MFMTVVNFRNERGRWSVDSKLTRPWAAAAVEALPQLKKINSSLDVQEQYQALPEYEGMRQLAHAFQGMSMRRSMDGRIEGPFVLTHEEAEVTEQFLLGWRRCHRKKKGW